MRRLFRFAEICQKSQVVSFEFLHGIVSTHRACACVIVWRKLWLLFWSHANLFLDDVLEAGERGARLIAKPTALVLEVFESLRLIVEHVHQFIFLWNALDFLCCLKTVPRVETFPCLVLNDILVMWWEILYFKNCVTLSAGWLGQSFNSNGARAVCFVNDLIDWFRSQTSSSVRHY